MRSNQGLTLAAIGAALIWAADNGTLASWDYPRRLLEGGGEGVLVAALLATLTRRSIDELPAKLCFAVWLTLVITIWALHAANGLVASGFGGEGWWYGVASGLPFFFAVGLGTTFILASFAGELPIEDDEDESDSDSRHDSLRERAVRLKRARRRRKARLEREERAQMPTPPESPAGG